MALASALADTWLHTPWLLWGVGPVLASNIGFFTVCTLLEVLLMVPWFQMSSIVYSISSSHGMSRQQLAAATHQRIPFWKQVSFSHSSGATALYVLIKPTIYSGVIQSLRRGSLRTA
eukprot:GHUV01014692.1.p1 GENE.GHUV01014692.1~~GHUV01014692.1.p1  ORF type:complete len:117 (+),score=8.81 GHUV01014692.1:767-1117(+)